MSTSERGAELTVDGLQVPAVAAPESVEELRELIRTANSDGAALLLTGNGTRLRYGNPGGPFDLAVSTRRLNRIIEHAPEDLTLAAEPGCTVAQINEALAAEGQQLPLDVAHPERATIGGSYATGLSGPQRMLNGSLKDLVLGVDVVNPRGTVARAGGMVVKNVTGFDLVHLYYGSHGAFGAVSRLNLRVSPIPPCTREYRFKYPSADDAHGAGVALLRAGIELMALFIIWDRSEGWVLHVCLSGSAGTVDSQGNRVSDIVSDTHEPVSHDSHDSDGGPLESFARFIDLESDSGVARFSVTASRQLDLLNTVTDDDIEAICVDLGSGLTYVVGNQSADWRDRMLGRGDPAFLSLSPDLKASIDVFGDVLDPVADIIRNLKSQYDSDGRFNRGRFVLGL